MLVDGLTRTLSRATQIESLTGDRGEHAEATGVRVSQWTRQRDDTTPWPVLIVAERLDEQPMSGMLRVILPRGVRQAHRRAPVATRGGDHAHVASG